MLKKAEEIVKTQTFREGILYLIIGGSAVLLDAFGFFILFNLFDIDSILSTVISITIATIYSFILNSKYNFRKTDKPVKRLILFSIVSGIGMLVSMGIIYLMDHIMGINANIAKVISLPIIAILQFVLNKLITFR